MNIKEALFSKIDRYQRATGTPMYVIAQRGGITASTLDYYRNSKSKIPHVSIERLCQGIGIRWQDLDVSIDLQQDPAAIARLKHAIDALHDAPEPLVKLAGTVIDGIVDVARAAEPTPAEPPEPVSQDTDSAHQVPIDPPPPPAVEDNILPFDQNYDEMRDVVEVLVPMWDYIAASPPDDTEPEFIGYFPVVHSYKKPGWKVIRLHGDSMEPEFMSGDFLLVDVNREAHKGDLVVAVIEGKGGTFKKYGGVNHRTGMVKLIPHNKKHKTINLPAAQVKIVAVYEETTRAKRGK